MSAAAGVRWRVVAVVALLVGGAHWLVLRATGAALRPASHPSAGLASLQLRALPPPTRDADTAHAAEASTASPSPPTRPDDAPAARAAGALHESAPERQPSPAAPFARDRVADAAAEGDPRAASAPPQAAAGAAHDGQASSGPTPSSGGPLDAVAVPAAATLHYQASASYRGVRFEGQAQLQWRHDGSQYDARFEIALPGRPTRVQRSTGLLTVQGLAPVRFSDRTRSEEAAHFDRTGQRIVFSTNRPDAPLEPGAQDRLSVLLQLSSMLAGQPARFAVGREVRLQIAGTREADTWSFTVDAQETLALPAGNAPALRLARPALHEHDGLLQLWLGLDPPYAPVRLRLTHPGGDWLELQWSGTDKG